MTRNPDGTYNITAGVGYTGDGTRVQWDEKKNIAIEVPKADECTLFLLPRGPTDEHQE